MSKLLPKLDRTKQDELLMKPCEYINKVPSKYHKTLCLSFNHWLRVPEETANKIGEILQIIHTASLLIDDIQDECKVRYGVPAAHHIFTVGLTINAAVLALGTAYKMVLAFENPMATSIFSEAVLEVSRGQGIEIYWRDNFICPTEEEYMEMIKQKSAEFFILAVRLLQLFSDNKEDYLTVATLFGVYYQIRDDYCNLFNREALKKIADNIQMTKESDNDITGGTFTFPIIYALKCPDAAQNISNIIKQRTNDVISINYCISLLEKCGAEKYTRDVLIRLESDIENEITRLGGNPVMTRLMEELGNWRRK